MISQIFWQKSLRANFRNFRTVFKLKVNCFTHNASEFIYQLMFQMFAVAICFQSLWFSIFANYTWHPPLSFTYEQSTVHRAKYRLKIRALTKLPRFMPFQYTEKLQIMNKLSGNLQTVLESCFYFIQDEDYLFENKTLLQETILSCAIQNLS